MSTTPLPFPTTAAIILAGGRSRRMGRDKRQMSFDGMSLVEHSYRRLSRQFSDVLISVREDEVLVPGARHVPDAHGDTGPLGAVISGMAATDCDTVFVTACDIPDPPETLIREMLNRSGEYDIVVPVDHRGRYETLFAVYSRQILPVLTSLLESGEKRLRMAYPLVSTLEIGMSADAELHNLNTPEDVRRFLSGSG